MLDEIWRTVGPSQDGAYQDLINKCQDIALQTYHKNSSNAFATEFSRTQIFAQYIDDFLELKKK